jgi:hypothetical protein
MKRPRNRDSIFLIGAVILFVAGLYGILGVPSKEGLNPSDDGVILAQSYRLLNGEIPHRDFVSIRPVGSAVMHAINFYSPLPLELSARWLVLMEYLFTAILISLLLVSRWFRGLRPANYLALLAGSILFIFVMNQNHYNLFPWTTIDALFWFSLSLFLANRVTEPGSRGLIVQVFFWFSISFSALCRQTFALPGLILGIQVLVRIWKENGGNRKVRLRRTLAGLIPGLLPLWIYAAVLTFSHSWADFVSQMTGRTEFWETGVVRFTDSFWQSPMPALFILVLFAGLIKRWVVEAERDPFPVDLAISILKLGSFSGKVLLVLIVFIKPGLLFPVSFLFFWFLVLDLLLLWIHAGRFPGWARPVGWILLVAWTSAISLGDNAPVFALGWLSGTAFLVQIKDFHERRYRNLRPVQLVLACLLIPALLVLSVRTQLNVNYRDLPAGRLTERGGDIFPGLKGIRLSPAMAGYLGEIRDRYESFGSPRGRFAVWPNNALIYPLLDSPDPFPLDWMQAAEFIGNEQRVNRSVRKVLETPGAVVLVERMNVKWLATEQVPIDRNSADYPYLKLLDSLAQKVEAGSTRFDVYVTK